jgi:hypothetical protein
VVHGGKDQLFFLINKFLNSSKNTQGNGKSTYHRADELPLFFAPNHPLNGRTAIEIGLAVDATEHSAA